MAKLSANLAVQLMQWRNAGEAIVFTNGVFDLIHPGHIAQLEAARAFGDRLVVGLNSDYSVQALGKGDDRPILNEFARATVVAALRCVDAVALFDEPTPLELITLVQPDVLVKGADYAVAEVVGREVVEARGGRVELIPLVPGFSTTAIIKRIRGE
jgi:rfaE bifunctional protein nucleotidyltransferase chain/domain